MNFTHDFLSLVGNTPLVKLRALSAETGCAIFGKAEFMNPGGSVKDRAAKGIIEAAEASGELSEGGTIVEGTAGNTGISLTLAANAKGYCPIIVMPETQSQEKKDALRLYGADLRLVPAVPYKDPNNYVRYSERLAAELSETNTGGVIWANQFDNIVNREAHYNSTGPEFWSQTKAKIDGFICAIGSGGTLAGTGLYLKEKNPDIQIGLADPYGSGMYHYYKYGSFKSEGGSISEGIGQGRITANLDGAPIDRAYQISDEEALPHLYNLLAHEGLYLGGSSAINIAGARQMALDMGPGHTICTILCDSGARYQSKVWNPNFLRAKNLPIPDWLEL